MGRRTASQKGGRTGNSKAQDCRTTARDIREKKRTQNQIRHVKRVQVGLLGVRVARPRTHLDDAGHGGDGCFQGEDEEVQRDEHVVCPWLGASV